jgi:hypothetical protein
MGTNLRLALIVSTAALLLPLDAVADQDWKTNSAIWRQQDACVTQAQKANPDYTPESNAKREKARLTCLRAHNLPTGDSPSGARAETASPQQ